MKTQLFAVFAKGGFVRATKTRASMGSREIGVLIDVEIPDRAFDDGFLHASIAVPDAAYVLPEVSAFVRGNTPAPVEGPQVRPDARSGPGSAGNSREDEGADAPAGDQK